MTIQHHLPDKIVQADPWTFYCAACSQKMRIKTLASLGGMKRALTDAPTNAPADIEKRLTWDFVDRQAASILVIE
jgi:hypothetical protein